MAPGRCGGSHVDKLRSGEANRTFRAGYGYRPGDFLDVALEASRREASNDNRAEHEIGLRARLRW